MKAQAAAGGLMGDSRRNRAQKLTLIGLYSPFLMANQGSKGGGGPLSSLGGLGCDVIASLISDS